MAARTWYVSGSRGTGLVSGLNPNAPANSFTLVQDSMSPGDTVYHEDAPDSLTLTGDWSFTQVLMWQKARGVRVTPSPRLDKSVTGVWANQGGNTWKVAFATALASVASVIVNPDTTLANAWGDVPCHMKLGSSTANVQANADFWFATGTEMWCNFGDGINPNTNDIRYLEVMVTGSEKSGILVQGNNVYVEVFPRSCPGWGSLLYGDNCQVKMFGALNNYYKMAAISGDNGSVIVEPGAVLSGVANKARQIAGNSGNGNGGITMQGPADKNTARVSVGPMDIYANSWLWRNNGLPVDSVRDLGNFVAVLNHGQGHLVKGQKMTGVRVFNPAKEVGIDGFSCNDATVPTDPKDPATFDVLMDLCSVDQGVTQHVQDSACFRNCNLSITLSDVVSGIGIYSSSGVTGMKVLIIGGLVVWNSGAAGGVAFQVKDTMGLYLINVHIVNIASKNANTMMVDMAGTTSFLYMRQVVGYCADNEVYQGNVRILGNSVSNRATQIDMQECVFIGFGSYGAGDGDILAQMPCKITSSGAVDNVNGTNWVIGNTAAATVFQNPLISLHQVAPGNTELAQIGADYQAAAGAPVQLRTKKLVTPHTTAGKNGPAYDGTPGCFQYNEPPWVNRFQQRQRVAGRR